MKKDEIYIDLYGLTTEELTDLWELLRTNGENLVREDLNSFLTSSDEFLHCDSNIWLGTYTEHLHYDKKEVTVEELKEILNPMTMNFKKGDTIIIKDFGKAEPSGAFSLNKPYKLKEDISEGLTVYADNNGIENGYSIELTKNMKIEFYNLTEQLSKAKAEVERLKKLIEEENKPKIGDFVYDTNANSFYKKLELDYIESQRKIINPELIKLLEDEILREN